jgi:beta-galactosidase
MPLLSRVPGLAFGGDYNAEQWPEAVWAEDVELMKAARVNLATVGVFSWAALEPSPGRFEFGWLDKVLDRLAAAEVRVDLATATAAPPPWFSAAYPQSLPIDVDGRRLWYGSRQGYCPSSPEYRAAALHLVDAIARRYAEHPALALWHVGNEYGCHVPRCYCDVSAAAFREWLRRKYADDLDALNAVWGTAFWSQRYSDWAQILPPRATPSYHNPTQVLDFRRFSSAELLDCFRAERDLLHELSPGVPVTTNFMTGSFWELDYWAWAAELDVISSDHYTLAEQPHNEISAGFAADVARSLAGGQPWLLMEHSTSAVNWQPRNVPKPPGRMRQDSLSHVARGSEGAMFFQWRASVAGAEKYHSAMVPHRGTDTRIWGEVTALGADLAALAEVAGSVVERPEVAMLLDYDSLWAGGLPAHPSVDLTGVPELEAWYAALWRAGIRTDFVHPHGDLSGYRLVLAPAQYLLDDRGVANLVSYVDGGGHLALGPFGGVVDEHDHVRPGRLDALLGTRVEEVHPLPSGARVALDDGTNAVVWAERVRLAGGAAAASYAADAGALLAGRPAITRNGYGAGIAWYLTVRLEAADLDRWLRVLTETAGVAPVLEAVPSVVDAVRRRHPDGRSYLFLVNHGAGDAVVRAAGTDLLTGRKHDDDVAVPGHGVVVLVETGTP